MRERLGAHWSIIHSLPSSKAILLKSFLSKKFPQYVFENKKFEDWSQTSFKSTAGIILELKDLSGSKLRSLDSLWKRAKALSTLIILTPESHQLLKDRRPQILKSASIILSDRKSLDYIPQLPRWIESAERRDHLKTQNERLQLLMEKTFGAITSFSSRSPSDYRNIAEDMIQGVNGKSYCGLRISLQRWPSLKKKIGLVASSEITETITRMINSTVRHSDRVLHWKDDEFLIFLSNAEPKHLNLCRKRVEQLLSSLNLVANEKPISLPFSVRTVEQMAFIN